MTPQSTEYVIPFMSYDSSKTGTFETNISRKTHFQYNFYIVTYVLCFMKQAITLEGAHLAKQVIYQIVAYEV